VCNRDGYFSSLKVSIEAMARREKKKVVLLGHSMGNRVIQYFLNWVRTAAKRHRNAFLVRGSP
jgi:triacylglycerol esterase/lipase EstA (alpha/beta hydrolase family)